MRAGPALAYALVLLFCTTASAAAQPSERTAGRTLQVGICEIPPFSFKNAAGQWTGISVDLWKQIANGLHYRYTFVEAPRDELILRISRNELDIAVNPFAITAERERVVDFTHVFYTSGLSIVVLRDAESVRWQDVVSTIFSKDFAMIFGALFAFLLLAGAAMWLLERKQNANRFSRGVAGIGDGFWWSGVTFTGVGYGDKVPVTAAGRLVALVWMLVSVICVSALTATVTAKLSLGHLSAIRGYHDLGRHVVGAVEGSVAQAYLRHHDIATKPFPTLGSGLDAVASRKVDAFVDDAATLKFLCRDRLNLTILPQMVETENYGFIIPNGSPLREEINLEMLTVTEQPVWRDIELRYLQSDVSAGHLTRQSRAIASLRSR